jgi:ATP-dependent RNA helicase DeaD
VTAFADLGLSDSTLQALQDVGYEQPSPIQEQAIPVLLEGRDMIGQAQTGSGKTAAFGLPMIEHVDPSEPEVQALVLTPTRELCIQVTQALRAYAERKGVDVVAVFGGAPIRSQQAQLRDGGQIVVGTVGRVLDLIQRASLILHSCRFVVLDEADEMLDLGFLEDVERILTITPNSRQTALFSATMPPPIRALADRYLYDPVTVKVKSATLTVDSVEQFSVDVKSGDKAEKLVDVLRAERPDQAIVFTRTKIRCDQLYRRLRDRGLNVKALHGDMSQGQRDGVMLAFKGGRLPVLVATDVAARGIHVDDVSLVLHYDPPTDAKTYLHRSGRTARAGAAGVVVSLLLPDQVGQAKRRFRSAKVDPDVLRIRPGDSAIADLVAKGVHVEPKERTQRDMRRGPGGPGRPRRDGDRPSGSRGGPRRSYGDSPRPAGDRPSGERSYGDRGARSSGRPSRPRYGA